MNISGLFFFFFSFSHQLLSRQTSQMFRINRNSVSEQEEQPNLNRNRTSKLRLEESRKPDFHVTSLIT